MLKKWIEITTKYQKEILIGLCILIVLIIVIYYYKKRNKKPHWLAPKYPVSSSFRPSHRPDHNGTDYASSKGSIIQAIESGIVLESASGCVEGNQSCNGQRGNYVLIDHENGYKSIYLHLDSISVKPKQKVKRGQIIGTMGNTGFSTGTHLHLSITKNGAYIDPEKLFKGEA